MESSEKGWVSKVQCEQDALKYREIQGTYLIAPPIHQSTPPSLVSKFVTCRSQDRINLPHHVYRGTHFVVRVELLYNNWLSAISSKDAARSEALSASE
jgi:hypothetical protein